MAGVKVTFAFVTPGTINCCGAIERNEELTVDVSRAPSEELQHESRTAILKVFDYDTGYARVFHITHPIGTKMRAVHESLADAMAARASEMVCFSPPPLSSEHVLHACAMKVLEPTDTVPEVVFCQKAAVSRQIIGAFSGWLVVNVFLCGTDGALSVGHLPCLVQVPCASITKDSVCTSLCALLGMGPECERRLRGCALVCCTAEGRSIVLRDLLSDGACPNQVAVLYSAVDVGDVVLVSAPLRRSDLRAGSSVFQAVVVRRFVEDGVTLYDVKEVDTSVILERLTCTQLVPL
ncbi:hypothetical protein JKF63_04763 [Porcisia hertigi]|uniref:Uncharacterized protein n=1 Tax=Porcisia hertigi TaxID=2761500 RepID=A0A836IMR9_9TRYP|nr:hypothetical protein JKF63_04763 [Porcisia hertigi]